MTRSRLNQLFLAAVLFSTYFVTAIFGLKVHAVSGFATLVWIPSGLALAFLFKFGLRFWPAVALAALLANYFNGAPILVALGISLGNTLEPVVGAYLLKRFVKLETQLNRINHVIGLIIFAALFSTLISATIGVTSLLLGNIIERSAYGSAWFAWWSGDAISDLVIAPLLLVWSTRPTITLNRKNSTELVVIMLLVILLGQLIFGEIGWLFGTSIPKSYFMFPVLILAALRLGQRLSLSAVFILSMIATWNTFNGFGPFGNSTPSDNLLNLQIYMAVVSTTIMILAAAISEQKKDEYKKDEFIAVASHELKTPITSIKTYAQTLQLLFERKGDKQSADYLNRINRQIDRLHRLVVKLLDLTRMQEGKVVLLKEEFNVGKLAREIAEEIAATTHHKILIQGNVRTNVFADRDRTGRVLTNLLSNAATYSPKASKIIVKITQDNGYAIISVQDFGIGIDKEDQDHIFERFYQLGINKSKPNTSLGLGLYITKEIVERHGGSVWIESSQSSKKGKTGSIFYFTLPTSNIKSK